VTPGDEVGVKMLYPANGDGKASGCNSQGQCGQEYNAPDDTQTQGTSSHDLICLLGVVGGTETGRTLQAAAIVVER